MIWALVLLFLLGGPTVYAWKVARNVVRIYAGTDSPTLVHLVMAVLMAAAAALAWEFNGGATAPKGSLTLFFSAVYFIGCAALFTLAFVLTGLSELFGRRRRD